MPPRMGECRAKLRELVVMGAKSCKGQHAAVAVFVHRGLV